MIRQFLFWSDMQFVVRVVHDAIIIMRSTYSFVICFFFFLLFIYMYVYLYIYFGEDAMEVSDCNSWDYYLSLTKVYSNLNTSSGILF